MLVAPELRWRPQNRGSDPSGTEGWDNESPRAAVGTAPAVERTCSRRGIVLQAPLQQAVGNTGLGAVEVP